MPTANTGLQTPSASLLLAIRVVRPPSASLSPSDRQLEAGVEAGPAAAAVPPARPAFPFSLPARPPADAAADVPYVLRRLQLLQAVQMAVVRPSVPDGPSDVAAWPPVAWRLPALSGLPLSFIAVSLLLTP